MNAVLSGESPVIVSFGGGTNSTAMLCGFRERGIVPALICFADTGAELPHTYAHVEEMAAKCFEWWGLRIAIVQKLYKGRFEGLDGQCIRHKQLPSLAYGRKSCSMKYKGDPQDREAKRFMRVNGISQIVRAIGFDAGESWRGNAEHDVVPLTKKLSAVSWYPLREWQWRRADCFAAIARHGIKQPGKSSCFMCPSRKPPEVLRLREEHPALFERGLLIEATSEGRPAPSGGKGINGLHFGIKWSDIAKADDAQAKLFEWVGEHASPAIPCGCYDG